MARLFKNITETIGHTPLVRLNRVTEGIKARSTASASSSTRSAA